MPGCQYFLRQVRLISITSLYVLNSILLSSNLLKAEGSYSQSDDVLSSDIPKRPIFRLNATALAIGDVYANSPTFRTQLALFSPGDQHSNLMYYPFDT